MHVPPEVCPSQKVACLPEAPEALDAPDAPSPGAGAASSGLAVGDVERESAETVIFEATVPEHAARGDMLVATTTSGRLVQIVLPDTWAAGERTVRVRSKARSKE